MAKQTKTKAVLVLSKTLASIKKVFDSQEDLVDFLEHDFRNGMGLAAEDITELIQQKQLKLVGGITLKIFA